MKRIIPTLCLLAFFLSAGSAVAAVTPADLKRFPQEASAYLPADPDRELASYEEQKIYAEEALHQHFAPWMNGDISYLDLSFDKIIDFHKATVKKQHYTTDGKPFPKEAMRKLYDNAPLDPNAEPRYAISLADADVRILATDKPLYTSAASALGARGLLKLDAMQNSALRPGEPLAIYAVSKDGAWCYISNDSVVGWVRANKVAFVGEEFVERYINATPVITIRDNIKLKDSKGNPVANVKMGTLLPREGENLLYPKKGNAGLAEIATFKLPEGTTASFPVPFTPRNASRAIDQLIGEPYGWGGLFGFRDCSAMTRDYFRLFGIWLPRNSGDQARTGAVIPLKNIPVGERPKTVLENAVPYATLIHMPGHIMLYLGLYDNEPVVLHNMWGVRIKTPDGQTGRVPVGKTVVSSLKIGAEIPNRGKSSLLVENLSALAFPMADVYK